MDDFDDYLERKRQQARCRLGIAPGEHCAFPKCSEVDPLYLNWIGGTLMCYEHGRLHQRRAIVEEHHPATRKIEPKFRVPIFGNDHRVLTVRSARWTGVVKKIKDGQLQAAFGRFFALRDVERQMVERSGPPDEVVLDILLWLAAEQPGWEQEFQRYRNSTDPSDS